eukprot:245126_1
METSDGLLLVRGFANKLLFIPDDIYDLILIYLINSFFFVVDFYELEVISRFMVHKPMKVINMNHKTIKDISYDWLASHRKGVKFVVNDIQLPNLLKSKLSTQHREPIRFFNQNHNQWSALFRFYSGTYHNYERISYNLDHWNHVTLFNSNLNSDTLNAFNVSLPSLPKSYANPLIIYNKYNNQLHGILKEEHESITSPYSVYTLDLNNHTLERTYSWQKKCNLSEKEFDCYSDASLCMIDHGKFIAIMSEKNFYLFSLAINKHIKLENMNEFRLNEPSVYNRKYHQIIIGGTSSFERYDINKNKWYKLPDTNGRHRYYPILCT